MLADILIRGRYGHCCCYHRSYLCHPHSGLCSREPRTLGIAPSTQGSKSSTIKPETLKITYPWAPWVTDRPFQGSGSARYPCTDSAPVQPGVFCLFRHRAPMLSPESDFLPFGIFQYASSSGSYTFVLSRFSDE